jgi:hypothetical protein
LMVYLINTTINYIIYFTYHTTHIISIDGAWVQLAT